MSQFFFVASVMCLLAVILVLLPLRRKQATSIDRASINVKLFKERRKELDAEKERGLIDEQQLMLAVEELEKGLLLDLSANEASDDVTHPKKPDSTSRSMRFIVITCVLVIPTVSFLLYFQLGSYQEEKAWVQLKREVEPALIGLEKGEDRQADLAKYTIQDIVTVLQARLQQEGGSPQGWLLLGLLYSQANKMDVAITAFKKAAMLAPNHPDIKIAYAEALMKQNRGVLNRESIKLLQEVLENNPDNPRALTLMGMGSYNAGFYQEAIDIWEQLLKLRGEDSEKAPLLRKSIQMAEQAILNPLKDSPNVAQQQFVSDQGAELEVSVTRLQQLVMQERRLTSEIEALLKQIFAIKADHPKALAFEGMLSFNAGQYQRAINSWEKLLKQREPGSERWKLVQSSLQKAKAKLTESK